MLPGEVARITAQPQYAYDKFPRCVGAAGRLAGCSLLLWAAESSYGLAHSIYCLPRGKEDYYGGVQMLLSGCPHPVLVCQVVPLVLWVSLRGACAGRLGCQLARWWSGRWSCSASTSQRQVMARAGHQHCQMCNTHAVTHRVWHATFGYHIVPQHWGSTCWSHSLIHDRRKHSMTVLRSLSRSSYPCGICSLLQKWETLSFAEIIEEVQSIKSLVRFDFTLDSLPFGSCDVHRVMKA